MYIQVNLLSQVHPRGQHGHTEGGPASETSLWIESEIMDNISGLYILQNMTTFKHGNKSIKPFQSYAPYLAFVQ